MPIETRRKRVSTAGVFEAYAKPDASTAPLTLSESQPGDKPKRKRTVVTLGQIVRASPIQPGQRAFDPSRPEDLELADSIKYTGLQDPITILLLGVEADRAIYELVDGHRRFGAMQNNAGAHWSSATIEAEILATGEDKTTVALHANRGIRKQSQAQRGEQYGKLRQAEKLSVRQIRDRYHLKESEEYIQRLIMAWESPEPVRALFRRGLSLNAALDFRGVWNSLTDSFRQTYGNTVAGLSFEGARLFISQVRAGLSHDDALQQALAISPPTEEDDVGLADAEGQGADSTKKSKSKKGKSSSKGENTSIEPLFYALGISSDRAKEIKRAGGSDTQEALVLASLAIRRGLDVQTSLSSARSLLHSRALRHNASRLSGIVTRVVAKPSESAEYQYLLYILGLSPSRPYISSGAGKPKTAKTRNRK